MTHFPLLYFPLLYSLLLTWLPPAVTGIIHLSPRLLVNWLPLSPIVPLYPSLRNPDPSRVFPKLNVHPIRAISQTQFPVYDTVHICTENTRNESVCTSIQRVCKIKENPQTQFRCAYLLNLQNESVCKLRVSGMNLLIYWEYAEIMCLYTGNMQNARKVEITENLKPKSNTGA